MKKSKTLFVTFSLLFAAMGGIISSRDDKAIGAIVELYPTDDTTIRQNRPYSNYGDTEQLSVRNECGGYPPSQGDGWGWDILIKFDLSSIPPGCIIKYAKLKLYYCKWWDNNPAGRVLSLYRVVEDWDEDTVTWKTQPSYDNTVVATATVPSQKNKWMEWNVTADVINFLKGIYPNYGWRIRDEQDWCKNDIPITRFYSKEKGMYIPHLEIKIVPTSLQVNWTYPSSDFFERWMHYPYEVKLNVSAGALPDGERNFTFGLDYNFTAYNLLGEEIQPEWELNENTFCTLSNSSHNQTYNFGTILNTTIISNETKEWSFIISNRWNWIEPWSMKRILNIILSIATAYFGTLYYEELQELLAEKDFEGYAETISDFINAVWHLKYNYHGLGNSSSSPGSVDVWVSPVKPSLLVESLIAAHLASKATSSGFTALISPFVGWGIAAAFFAVQGAMWVVSEITYASSVDPDYNFTVLATPENVYLPIVENLTDNLARNVTMTAFDLLSFAEARKVSYARYLGAIESNSPKWAAIQLAATRYYGEMEKIFTEKLRMQLEGILEMLPSPTDDDVKAIKDMLATEGLPDIEVDILRQLGYTNQDINDLTDFYLDVNTSFYKNPSSILYLLENMTALIETSNNLLPPLLYDELIQTNIDVNPHIIDADNVPEYIDFYIEFDDISAIRGVSINSCKLNDIINPVYISETPGDHDGDSLPDILVRFNASDI
ncbi:MAG: hypothetical protein DRN18_01790, partial [Thermoplasmata archaeon]